MIAQVVARRACLRMLDMYLLMCIGRYTAFGSILKQNGTCYNSPKIMDAIARYTMVPAVHANLMHPLLQQADKMVMISRDSQIALKVVVIDEIIQHISRVLKHNESFS